MAYKTVSNGISKYLKAIKKAKLFKDASFKTQYESFIPLVMEYSKLDCLSLVTNLVNVLKLPTNEEEVTKTKTLYTIAVFVYPMSIKGMRANYLTEKMCDIATKAYASLITEVPFSLRTLEMYARKESFHRQLLKSVEDISNIVKTTDILSLQQNLAAKTAFSLEVEFLPIQDVAVIKKYIETVLEKCDNIPEYYKTFKITPDLSAPAMHEITALRVDSWEGIGVWLGIMLCLEALETFKLVKVNDSCGIHLHSDQANSDYARIKAIERAYLNNITVITRLMTTSRTFNNYCIPSVYSPRYKEDQLRAMSKEQLRATRYHVVNTNAWFYFKSMEFRQYNSTTKLASVFSWVEFINKLINSHETVGYCLTLKTLFNKLDLSKASTDYFLNKFESRARLF